MRAGIIFNPTAGLSSGSPEAALQDAAAVWIEQGWHVELYPTSGPGDATRLARAAVDRHDDVVIAAGGDGTINEVVNGLAGSSTIMGSIPLGTMNVWARELRLPLQPRAAAAALLDSQVRPIDLGRANGRYFLLMAGIGLDAAVTAGIGIKEKRRLGALAYILHAVKLAINIQGTRSRLIIDGKVVKGRVLMVVIGNSQLYGGVIKITHRASIDDGLLDICVIKGNNFLSAVYRLLGILVRPHIHDPQVQYYRARTVDIRSYPALPVQVDGESIGDTPMRFEVAPGALRALLPVQVPNDLVHDAIRPIPGAMHSLRDLTASEKQPEQSRLL